MDGVRDTHLEWLHRHGLLETTESTRRYRQSQVADLAAYCDPESKDLLLSYNVIGWIFLHDDWMDTSADRMADHAVTAELITILHRPLLPTYPLASAFADIWGTLQTGMSEAWRQRMAWLWQQYFYGNLAEAVDRRERRKLTSSEHIRVKEASVAIAVMYAVAERTGGFEIPAELWHATFLNTLRHHVTRYIIFMNDIESFKQDEAAERTNLISLTMAEMGLSSRQSLQHISAQASEHLQNFYTLEAGIDQFCRALHLPANVRHSVGAHIAGLHNWVHGSSDWYRITSRYSLEDTSADSLT
ncbi:hypothetical protein B0293_28850 [Amycolatopsis azurea DSM 43854]|uniref:Terpene synthase n=2 Tax=Amycolatopsis azurea TaxID=36819 RepID=A0ABX3J5P6_9PSEU|nr:hypothetical protein B0293_28850 [Amycolatopsis azurea DSM 43854]